MEIISDTIENGKRKVVAKYTEEEKAEMKARAEKAKAEIEARNTNAK